MGWEGKWAEFAKECVKLSFGLRPQVSRSKVNDGILKAAVLGYPAVGVVRAVRGLSACGNSHRRGQHKASASCMASATEAYWRHGYTRRI